MHQPTQETPGPVLVLIDPHKMQYTRYVGKESKENTRAIQLLTVAEVEQFRVDPKSMIEET